MIYISLKNILYYIYIIYIFFFRNKANINLNKPIIIMHDHMITVADNFQ